MKFKRRQGEFEQGCVLSESYTATDALPPILPACRQLLLPACVFVTQDTVRHPRLFFFGKICLWTDLFVKRGIREPRFHCTTLNRHKALFSYTWGTWYSKHSTAQKIIIGHAICTVHTGDLLNLLRGAYNYGKIQSASMQSMCNSVCRMNKYM
jgi:hypothetical protein